MKRVVKILSLVICFIMAFAVCSNASPLIAAKDEPLLKVEMISDTHIGAEGAEEFVVNAIAGISNEADRADGLIIAGDLSNNGTEENDWLQKRLYRRQGRQNLLQHGNKRL